MTLAPDAVGTVLESLELDRELKATADAILEIDERTPSQQQVSPGFALGATLTALLQDELLPRPEQRIACTYTLYCLGRNFLETRIADGKQSENSTNLAELLQWPFSSVLLELEHGPQPEADAAVAAEKRLIRHVLFSLSRLASAEADPLIERLAWMSSASALKLLNSSDQHSTGAEEECTALVKRLEEEWKLQMQRAQPTQHGLTPVSAVVKLQRPEVKLSESLSPRMSLRELVGEDVQLHDFVPSFLRPLPATFPPSELELRWLDPEPYHEVIWDTNMCMERSRGAELRELMSKAIKSPLQPTQEQLVESQMRADPRLVYHCGLTPQKLPELVEKNPHVAIEVLLKLVSSRQSSEYFSALVSMPLSPHSMVVVNKVSTAVDVPPEFLHTYISNCMQACRDIRERATQNRLVRLLCVFLQSLICNSVIDVRDLFIEVQKFCIEFSRTREAAALFQQLRAMQRP